MICRVKVVLFIMLPFRSSVAKIAQEGKVLPGYCLNERYLILSIIKNPYVTPIPNF